MDISVENEASCFFHAEMAEILRINPSALPAPFLYPLKISQNLTVSGDRKRLHLEQMD